MNETFRVLWLTPDKPDDISVGRERIANHLRERGLDVVIRGTTGLTALDALVESREYDVVVGTTRAGAIAAAVISSVARLPLVVDHVDPIRQFEETNPVLSRFVRVAEEFAFRRSGFTLFVYEEESDRVSRHAGRFARTDLGVEYDRFADPDHESVRRAAERLEGTGDNVAIYVGGLEPIYNVATMLEAFEHLEEWTLVVLGDGSLAADVRTAAETMRNVVFLGTVPHEDVPGYLHNADVGLSLVDDPNTLKVLEYAAAGLPFVQLRGAADDRLEDLAEFCELDPVDVARAVTEASADDDELREFARPYGWDSIAEDYERAIRTVLGATVAE